MLIIYKNLNTTFFFNFTAFVLVYTKERLLLDIIFVCIHTNACNNMVIFLVTLIRIGDNSLKSGNYFLESVMMGFFTFSNKYLSEQHLVY